MAGLVQVVQKALSTEHPTEKDVKLSEGLMALMNAECLIPTQDESDRRVKSIGKLNEMVSLAALTRRSYSD
jgi:poly(A) polymerase Pap1